MIRENFHNTAWWGKPVAVVEDAAFFALEPAAQRAALRAYAWAEFKSPLASAPPFLQLAESGFTLVDMQIGFRLMLEAVPDSPSLADFVCQFADQKHFEVGLDEMRSFEHERFLQIPGASPEQAWRNGTRAGPTSWCANIPHGVCACCIKGRRRVGFLPC